MGLQAEVVRLSCKIRREFLKAKKKKEAAAAAKAAKGRDPTKEEAVCTRCTHTHTYTVRTYSSPPAQHTANTS